MISPFAFDFLSTFTSSYSSFLIQRDTLPLMVTSSLLLLLHSLHYYLRRSRWRWRNNNLFLFSHYTSGNLSLNTIHIGSLTFIFTVYLISFSSYILKNTLTYQYKQMTLRSRGGCISKGCRGDSGGDKLVTFK